MPLIALNIPCSQQSTLLESYAYFRNRAGDIYSSYMEFFVTQHDVLRDLALHVNNCEPLTSRRRLIMPRRESELPREWERNKDEPFEAQIVSINSGIQLLLLHGHLVLWIFLSSLIICLFYVA